MKILATLILSQVGSWGLCQSVKEQLEIANSVKLSSTDFYEEIGFVDRRGYLIIPVKIGEETYNYIFDTGGYNTVTTGIMKRNNLPKLMEVNIGSSNKIKSTVQLSKVPKIKIGNVDFESVGVFNFDFNESPLIKCYTNGGLIGKGVIKECVWQVDYSTKVIRVSDQLKKMPNIENSMRLKVRLDKIFNPFIKAEINGQMEEFLLDFGYGGFVSLTEKAGKKYRSNNPIQVDGEGTSSANGVSKEKMYVTKLRNFNIANSSFTNQMAFYSKLNNYNLIGTELLKYFIVTINLKDNEVILTPYKNEAKEPIESFGFSLNTKDGKLYVNRLYRNLPADKIGLRLGDEVLKVNDAILSKMEYCDFHFYINELLESAKQIKLEVNQDGLVKELLIEKGQIFN
jgi:hypothetical protein